MQRTILIALAAAVVAAGIATGVTIVLTDNDEVALATPSADPSPDASAEVVTPPPSATLEPGERSAEPSLGPGSTASPSGEATASTSPPIRTAASVDCDREERFCSEYWATGVVDGKYRPIPVDGPGPGYDGVPTIEMTWEPRRSDGTRASEGDNLHSLHIEITVTNKTSKTFVFPKREIQLVIKKDNRAFDTLTTTGEGFDMTPNGKMTGRFDRPITQDGTYSWQAKIWYHPK